MSGEAGHSEPSPRRQRVRHAAAVAATLLWGAAGGYVFYLLNLPLPWMMGAMCATVAVTLAGAPVREPGIVRDVMLAVIGLMIGGAFTPEILGEVGRWTFSLAGVTVYALGITLVIGWALKRFARFSPPNAFSSSAPGGLIQMIVMGGAMGGDERVISVMHSVRVMLTVIIIPFWFRFFYGYSGSPTGAFGSIADLTLSDGGVLIACAVGGVIGGKILRLPVPYLLGPVIVAV